MLQACLNGARLPAEHPRLPTTPEALAADAAAARAAGAESVHVHVKNAAGRDTFAGRPLAAALGAIRAAAPGLPVGVATGAWALPDPQARVANIETWQVLPDFASVNWHEDGSEAVAAALLDRGIGVEAGLWTPAALDSWRRFGRREECLRVLIELPDCEEDVTSRVAGYLLDELRATRSSVPVLLHGEDASTWPALRHARRLGLDTRIGLEDTLLLPDGEPAADNAALVLAALDLSR